MAHRGAWDELAPESSMAAYDSAVSFGFEILELDVRFSAAYRIDNDDMQVAVAKDSTTAIPGVYREIVLQHDKSPMRSDGDNLIPGLYAYDERQTFDESVKKKGKFVLLENLVPWRIDGKNCIDNPNKFPPVLLKLDGTESDYTLVHFPHDATPSTNDVFADFYNIVKDNILLNFDKLKDSMDFRETYDIMNSNGLLPQSIFKAKGIRKFSDITALFGSTRSLASVMFTPIFTKYDFYNESTKTHDLTDVQKYDTVRKLVDSLCLAEQQGKIVFPGCEIIYETADTASTDDDDYGWLTRLANYVKNVKGKRIIQFSTNIENRQGAWSGNGCSWSALVGIAVNYWSWLYSDSSTAYIRAGVFVGDKPLEFRSYLNSLGYNQTPIQ